MKTQKNEIPIKTNHRAIQFMRKINENLSFNRLIVGLVLSLILGGCGTITRYGTKPPEPLIDNKKNDIKVEVLDDNQEQSNQLKSRFKTTPNLKFSEIASAVSAGKDVALSGEPISLNLDSVPLPAFINEVFGNLLNQSFQISPKLLEKTDLVTLRIVDPVEPTALYYTTKQVLQSYGVNMVSDNGILQFDISRNVESSEPPLIISGQALPSVPATHRPVFYVVPLKVVKNNNAVSWLKEAFSGQALTITQDPYRNAIWLKGKYSVVSQAAEVVKVLDKPLMRGRHSLRIEPLFLGADKLVKRLVDVLQAEGFDASIGGSGTINFLPIEETNSIIVFATDEDALAHVKRWTLDLDKPLKQTKGSNLFIYSVKNTSAQSIADVLNQVNQGEVSVLGNKSAASTSAENKPAKAVGKMLIIDESRNALLFSGSNEEWTSLVPIIKEMDQAAVQVLLEVVVAEVKLSEDFSFGIEWAIDNAVLPDTVTAAARNAVNIGSGGISYFPMNSSGSTKAVLKALSTNSDVKLLQTPRVLVRSGQEASINVGDEVPIVTSQTSSNQQVGGTNALIQSVQYRRTGNSLSIKPVVYSGGQVDIEISQEISSAQKTSTSDLNSPTILNRSLNTSLTVKDGGSVLIGGLIQTEDSTGESRVPFLSDIPFIGKLFTQETITTSRTELMILVIPYVIRDDSDAAAITKAFKERLNLDWSE